MCDQCGVYFLVLTDMDAHPSRRFRVVKEHMERPPVELDLFADEDAARDFARQLHDDQLRARNFFKRFEECAAL